jgi:hypothetical protein
MVWIGGGLYASAHRAAFAMAHGYIPTPSCLHSCDNPPCVNVAHLREGTHADNMADRKAKGRYNGGDQHWSRLRPERMARGDKNGAHTHPEKWARGDGHWSRLHPEWLARGERNNNARITEDDVRAIREMSTRKMTGAEIAQETGLPRGIVYGVLSRTTWKHVP